VASSDKQARDELRAGATVDIEEQKIGRPALYSRYIPEGGTIADVTYDYLVDQGMIVVGDPDTVCQKIKDLYHETGGFGTLLMTAGRDWSTREKRARSMRLFREHVAPHLTELEPDSRGGYAVGY
jgi:alkanesulfonate monooxygenase SsuD/methylene tetrahydromethanopterin reductase-like flavin-dependent oxidoreductase (luciferase family)